MVWVARLAIPLVLGTIAFDYFKGLLGSKQKTETSFQKSYNANSRNNNEKKEEELTYNSQPSLRKHVSKLD